MQNSISLTPNEHVLSIAVVAYSFDVTVKDCQGQQDIILDLLVLYSQLQTDR